MNENSTITPAQQMHSLLFDGNEYQAIEYLKIYNSILLNDDNNWLHEASQCGMISLINYLVKLGVDINSTAGLGGSTPLDQAICADELNDRNQLIKYLLELGANPNISRSLIAALNPRRGDEDVSLELVRLLVEEGGADVNRVYDVYGDPNNTFTAVEWAEVFGRPKIAAYLRSQGAIDRPPQPTPPPPTKKKRKS